MVRMRTVVPNITTTSLRKDNCTETTASVPGGTVLLRFWLDSVERTAFLSVLSKFNGTWSRQSANVKIREW